MRQKALDIEQITKICHVSPTTVLRWLQKQSLKTIEIPGATPKVWRSDLISFLESIHEPVPKELVLIDRLYIVVMIYDKELQKQLTGELRDLLPNACISAPQNIFEAGLLTHEFNPHIFILDIDTPGVGPEGLNIIKSLKNSNRFQCTRIITIGSKDMENQRTGILESGSDAFFFKPIIVDTFKDSVAFQANELL